MNAKTEKVKLRPAAKVSGVSEMLAGALNIVAREVGVEMEELGDAVQLVDLGVDFLMTLTISGHFREELELDVESTLFADCLTVGDLERLLGSADNDAHFQHSSDDSDRHLYHSIMTRVSRYDHFSSTFHVGAGHGSWLLIPHSLCDSITHSPTVASGWSAGGIFAYEARRQMAAMQKANPTKNFYLEKLLLLDSLCSVALDPLPSRLFVFFNQIGLLGDGNPDHTPSWLLPHFQATIDSLKAYEPILTKDDPFDAPQALLVWCTDGMAKNPEDPRPPRQDDNIRNYELVIR